MKIRTIIAFEELFLVAALCSYILICVRFGG